MTLPRVCGSPRENRDISDRCPLDPYFVIHESCQFIDQQVLKIQEAPDQVPVGELPRHILVSADRYLANRVVPGTRCTIMGIFTIYNSKGGSKSNNAAVAIRNPYLRAVGITSDVDRTAKGSSHFTEEEEQEFLELSRRPDLYGVFADCIAPSIYGNADIKKAIACLLLGGSKKILPDGMKLRGDINVLLLGDPGTAKSQLLKFVEKAAPIAIYTSGKGSSAAGLTASVQRDTTTRDLKNNTETETQTGRPADQIADVPGCWMDARTDGRINAGGRTKEQMDNQVESSRIESSASCVSFYAGRHFVRSTTITITTAILTNIHATALYHGDYIANA